MSVLFQVKINTLERTITTLQEENFYLTQEIQRNQIINKNLETISQNKDAFDYFK
jgi:Tfp pilus assembly protein PilN